MFRDPSLSFSLLQWGNQAGETLITATSLLVFAILDLLDFLLCIFFRYADAMLEEDPHPCYCVSRAGHGDCSVEEEEVSETLYGRRNVFREMGLLAWRRSDGRKKKGGFRRRARWSDCDCETCVSWQEKGKEKLNFVVKEPSQADNEDCQESSIENVIFLHGMLSSSYLWVEAVFPNLSDAANQRCRLFAVDLLGFGASPKPVDCWYRMEDHIKMIEISILKQFHMKSFHLVAHSMGCMIALALASKYPESVKSVTLIAPPYFPSTKEEASLTTLNRVAERRIWPPVRFAISAFSWNEHVTRIFHIILCRNHRKWESALKLLTRRELHYSLIDISRHTHHSTWHTMHNLLCGGAKLLDGYLEDVSKSRFSFKLIHGYRDAVIPVECSFNMKLKVPRAELQTISAANHTSIIQGREKDLVCDLEKVWFSSAELKEQEKCLVQ